MVGRGDGLCLFDEPEASLSPQRELASLAGMHDLIQRESQFVTATRSPIIMACPEALLCLFDETRIHEIDHEDTEHCRVTRAFLMRREQVLRELFSEE